MRAMIKKIHQIVLTLLVLTLGIMILTGGIHWGGKIRLGYVTDLTRITIAWYILGLLTLKSGLSDTVFGQILRHSRARLALGISAVYLAAVFLVVPLFRHWAFGSWVWDLGIIENALRNLAFEGSAFTYFLSQDGGDTPLRYLPNNRLILGFWALAPIYRLFPWTETLLLLQGISLFSGAIPAFLLARKILPLSRAGYWGAGFYLALQTIHKLQVWDIHEVSFAIPFGLWAFWFLESKRFYLSLLFAALMAAWREDLWLVFAGFSLLWGKEAKQPLLGVVLAVAGLSVLPLHAHFFNAVNTVGSRYPLFGTDLPSAAANAIRHPWLVLQAAAANWSFFGRLLVMYGAGALLLAGPWYLLPAVLPLLELGLSQHPAMTSFLDHYVGNLVAPLFYAMLHGLRGILQRFPKLGDTGVTIIFALSQFWFNPELVATLRRLRADPENAQCKTNLIRPLTQNEARVIATNNLGSHLTNRKWIQLPQGNPRSWELAEWAVLSSAEAEQYQDFLKERWTRTNSACGYEVWSRRP